MGDKVFTYTIILVMLSLLFALIGVSTSVGVVMAAIGLTAPDNTTVDAGTLTGGLYTSRLYIAIALIATLGIIGVITGLVTRSSVESSVFVNTGIFAALLTFGNDYIAIVSYGWTQGAFAGWVATIICFPLYAGYLWTVVQAWRGID